MENNFIPTAPIKAAVNGMETAILSAIGIDWPNGVSHINCPYSHHDDKNPSWRWDDGAKKAFCNCMDNGSHSIFDVVSEIEGGGFDGAKQRIADILGFQAGGQYQKSDPESLLNPPAHNIHKTLGKKYLAHRLGISPDDVVMPSTSVVGWHALMYWHPTKTPGGKPEPGDELPCIVFQTKDKNDKKHAHRVYVAKDGVGKADVPAPKKSAKKPTGENTAGRSVIWGIPDKASTIILTEGIETGASVAHAFKKEIEEGAYAVAAAISTSGIKAFIPFDSTKKIIIAGDNDKNGAGVKAANTFARKYGKSIKVLVSLPNNIGADWLDVFVKDGSDAVRRDILNPKPVQKTDDNQHNVGFDDKESESDDDETPNGVIFEKDFKLWKRKGDEATAITSFGIKPLASVDVPQEGEHLRVLLHTGGGYKREVIFPPSAWVTNRDFIKHLPSKETTFTGTSTDVQHIRGFLASFQMPHQKGITTAGFHDDVFVTESGALDKNGPVDGLVFLGDNPSRCKLFDTAPATEGDLKEISEYITGFNTASVVLPLLGWATACFFKPIILKMFKAFPLLNIEGEAGSGKSFTSEAVISRMWCLNSSPYGIAEQTKFTLMKHVDGSNSIPILFEENKSSRMSQRQSDLISTMIRETYNSNEGQRGRANQSMRIYHYQAPVAIVGESGFVEPAVLDRFIPIQMSKKESKPFEEGFRRLRKLTLEKLGRRILEKALNTSQEDVKNLLEKELDAIDKDLDDRPRFNAAVVRFGLNIIGDILNKEFEKSVVDCVIKDAIFQDGSKHRKSAVGKIIESFGVMSGYVERSREIGSGEIEKWNDYIFSQNDRLDEGKHYYLDGVFIRIHVAVAYPTFMRWASTYKFDGDVLPKESFLRQIKKEDFFVDYKKSRIGSSIANCVILDLSKMTNLGLSIPEHWYNPENHSDLHQGFGGTVISINDKRKKLFESIRNKKKKREVGG